MNISDPQFVNVARLYELKAISAGNTNVHWCISRPLYTINIYHRSSVRFVRRTRDSRNVNIFPVLICNAGRYHGRKRPVFEE